MKVINGIDSLREMVGKEVGVSEWMEIDQKRINDFADATGDHQWIHVDEAKAKMSPIGTTIGHGFLTLSLIPKFMEEIWKVEGVKMGINYGLDKVRFPSMVPVNSKVRMRVTLTSLDEGKAGVVKLKVTATIEREGGDKPVCVAESLTQLYL